MTDRRLLVAAVLFSLTAFAQEAAAPAAAPPPPSADELKRVMDYIDNGAPSGPALLDLIPCAKVDSTKGSATAFECIEPVSGPVTQGTTVFAWTQWFCPRGGNYEDVSIQYVHEGTVRSTIDVKIKGLMRTRTWRGQTLTKPGKWEIKVLRAGTVLGSTTVQVEKK